jgi:hypothetical protein
MELPVSNAGIVPAKEIRIRRTRSAVFKAKVALAAVCGELTLAELA